jgi:hypothetical protein
MEKIYIRKEERKKWWKKKLYKITRNKEVDRRMNEIRNEIIADTNK